MTKSPSGSSNFEILAQRIAADSTLLQVWPLLGGVSAQTTGIELELPDGRRWKLVVREHGAVDRQANPHIARDEFKLLEIVHSHGLLVPEPVYLNESGDLFENPVIVMEFVDGQADFAPADLDQYLVQAAQQLARIHEVDDQQELEFLPKLGAGFGERPAQLDDSMGEGQIRDTLEALSPLQPVNAPVLLHGDYWPGNLLWKADQLVAVVDWEDAQVGDPLADVANCRLELLWAFGRSAMRQFTAHYEANASIDFSQLPYWDLCMALRPCSRISSWGLDAQTEQRMREEHSWFVANARNILCQAGSLS